MDRVRGPLYLGKGGSATPRVHLWRRDYPSRLSLGLFDFQFRDHRGLSWVQTQYSLFSRILMARRVARAESETDDGRDPLSHLPSCVGGSRLVKPSCNLLRL